MLTSNALSKAPSMSTYVRTYVLTKKQLTLNSYLTLSNARRGGSTNHPPQPKKPAHPDTTHPAPPPTTITHMPPVMDRKASTQRCRDGWELRCRGRTWQEIADTLGYKSHHNAYAAVTRWLNKNPPDDLNTLRRATGDTLRTLATRLADEALTALEEGNRTEAANLARAALDGLDRYAKLTGQHITPPATEITVNVGGSSAVAIIEQAEQQLLALAAATQPAPLAPLPVLDAEIIDQ